MATCFLRSANITVVADLLGPEPPGTKPTHLTNFHHVTFCVPQLYMFCFDYSHLLVRSPLFIFINKFE